MSRPTLAELRSEDMQEWLDEHDAAVAAKALLDAAEAIERSNSSCRVQRTCHQADAILLRERAKAAEAGDPA